MTFIDTDHPPRRSPVHGDRKVVPERDVRLRINDYYEVYGRADPAAAQDEAERCLKCGAAFCMPDSGYGQGCPINNKIPEWNELVRLGRWEDAYQRLSTTNPFPEFTSRVCPAPCQDACILGINEQPVEIKGIERAIIDRAFDEGWVRPNAPAKRTAKHVAIVGSGPAGLTAADRLNAMGHTVTVYERSDRPGGLLHYGVPSMKLDKSVIDSRIQLMIDSGIRFELNCTVGQDISADQLVHAADAVVLACGALKPRDLDLPGRSLHGIHQAIPYLTTSVRSLQSGTPPTISARDKHVVVIGAGDTGADCIATALRQGALSVTNLARGQQPPDHRDPAHAWPGPTGTCSYDYAHLESMAVQGTDPRWWRASPHAFLSSRHDNTRIGSIDVHDASGQAHQLAADLVILAIGFTGHDSGRLTESMTQAASTHAAMTGQPARPILTAGDMATGPSLVVNAIAEGQRIADRLVSL